MPRTRPTRTSKFPFDLGTTQAARTLIRTHQLLRGELLKHAEGAETFVPADECRLRMAELEAVLDFLDVDFQPAALKPRRAWPKIGPLGHGELRRGVLDALKQAGDWQTFQQLVDTVLRKHSITLSPAQHKHFLQKLREATHALKQAGAVSPERKLSAGHFDGEQRWRLSSMFD